MGSSTTARPASPRQLRYLRQLAADTGTTFTPPGSSRDASAEIDRLIALKRRRGRHVEYGNARSEAERLTYGTAPHQSEIAGYGVSAHWRTTHLPDPAEQARLCRPSREVS